MLEVKTGREVSKMVWMDPLTGAALAEAPGMKYINQN